MSIDGRLNDKLVVRMGAGWPPDIVEPDRDAEPCQPIGMAIGLWRPDNRLAPIGPAMLQG